MNQAETLFYVAGGTLRDDAPCYVERQADTDLYEALTQGEFCYVLDSRQMGKSSLMARTRARLREEGVAVASLDLTGIGHNLTAEQWYAGLLSRLGDQLDLEDELDKFWFAHDHLGPLQRWMAAIRQVALPVLDARCSVLGSDTDPTSPLLSRRAEHQAPSTERLVVFIDEIDAVRSLQFSADEFFAAIRECYTRRGEDAELNRLTFCLLGVATPSDLIQDVRVTPFNIGRRIELNDFTVPEAAPLAEGLLGGLHPPSGSLAERSGVRDPKERLAAQCLLEQILYWTGGHPYLTQRLCQAVVEGQGSSVKGQASHGSKLLTLDPRPLTASVDRLCEELFLSSAAREKDDNLLFVRDRLLRSEVDLTSLLDLYGKVRAGGLVRPDDANPLLDLLRLSGIAKVSVNRLVVRNRIYGHVFDREWVAQHMPDAEARRQKAAYRRGLVRATSVATAIVAAMAGLTSFAWDQRRQAQLAAQQAVAARQDAVEKLVRLSVDKGTRLMDDGDLFGALPWFVNALQLDQGKPAREAIHRARLASVLRSCPKLVQLWSHDAPLTDSAFSPDGQHVVTATRSGAARVWDARTGMPLTPPLKHQAEIHHVTFSPEGDRVLTASADGTAQLWDAATGRKLLPPLRHKGKGAVKFAVFSRDGHIATASADGTAQVWEAATGRPVAPPIRHAGSVEVAAFSPDGSRVLTVSMDQTVRVWDARTGQPVTPRPLPCFLVAAANYPGGPFGEFSPDGQRVVTPGAARNTAQVWDAATGQAMGAPLTHTSVVFHASFSPDGHRVVTAGADSAARVWDTATGQAVTPFLRVSGYVLHAEFSPDGRQVLTADGGGTARLWDATTGVPVGPILRHGGEVVRAAFSPDGRRILTASADHTARVWDRATSEGSGGFFRRLDALPYMTRFSPDGRRILAVSARSAWVLDAKTGWPLGPPIPYRQRQLVQEAVLSPDGRRVLLASDPSTARIWDIENRKQVGVPLENSASLIAAAFSSDGRRLVMAGTDKTVRVYDAATGRPQTPSMTHSDAVTAAAFSPEGRRVVTATGNGTARVWDAQTGRALIPPVKHGEPIVQTAFSPDGQRFITAGGGARARDTTATARVWDAATGKAIGRPLQHGGRVLEAAFSPEGRRVVTASVDGTARVWDGATGRPLTPPLQHAHFVSHAQFSPDGLYVLTASWDWTARIWDAATGEPAGLPMRVNGRVDDAQFSRDGRRIVTGIRLRNRVRVWDFPTETRSLPELVRLAELLTGGRMDDTSGASRIGAAEMRSMWEGLRSNHPRDFAVSPQEALDWHRWEAEKYADMQPPQWSGVRFHLERADQIHSLSGKGHLARGQLLAQLNRREDALPEYARAAQHPPHTVAYWTELGNSHAELGRFDQASAAYARAIELGGDTGRDWYLLALAQWAARDGEGYCLTCTSLRAQFGRSNDAETALWVALLAAFDLDGRSEGDLGLRAAETARAAAPHNFYIGSILGGVLYRAGRFQNAVWRLTEADASELSVVSDQNRLWRALCHARLGQAAAAGFWLDRESGRLTVMLERKAGGRGLSWDQRLCLEHLRDEAEALVRGSAKAPE